jgi:hypothetical protein
MECSASLDKECNSKVGTPFEMASMHYQQVASSIQEWKRTIDSNPAKFSELESMKSIEKVADMVLAAYSVMVGAVASFDAIAESTRNQHAVPVNQSRVRQILLRL